MMLQCRAKEKDMAGIIWEKIYKQNPFTRMCIGEAVFSLMDKKPYEEIRVSDIVKRAGVSRMTFYHYYEQKEDALADYFHEIVNGYVRERSEIIKKGGKFHDPGSIEHALKYFDQYAAFILKLVDAHLYHIILEAMNSFMMERIQPVYKIPPYELYFYGGALMNVFVMWEKNGKRETPESIAKTLASGAVLPQIRFQLRVTVIGKQKDAAQYPAQRIAQCDGDDRVCKLCDHVKINLAEHDKAAHHDDHGGLLCCRYPAVCRRVPD